MEKQENDFVETLSECLKIKDIVRGKIRFIEAFDFIDTLSDDQERERTVYLSLITKGIVGICLDFIWSMYHCHTEVVKRVFFITRKMGMANPDRVYDELIPSGDEERDAIGRKIIDQFFRIFTLYFDDKDVAREGGFLIGNSCVGSHSRTHLLATSDFVMSTLTHMIKCHQSSPKVLEGILHACVGLSSGKDSTIDAMVKHGFVDNVATVLELHPSNSTLMNAVCELLANLSCESGRCASLISWSFALPVILDVLKEKYLGMQTLDFALSAVINFAMESDEIRKLLVENDFVPVLWDVFNQGDPINLEFEMNAAVSLVQISKIRNEGTMQFYAKEIIPVLLNSLHERPSLRNLQFIRSICQDFIEMQKLMVSEGIISRLSRLLHKTCSSSSSVLSSCNADIVGLVLNVLHDFSATCAEFGRMIAHPSVLSVLKLVSEQYSSNDDVSNSLSGIIMDLVNTSQETREKVVAAGFSIPW
eukprot:TRINITY_DN10338_c0_g1_i1.p1 TRINITY_DN10338_c0_g1~~TRINITY_DN10338_c0_g1_i1.p1  ORF type:complete len:476 (-),score=102.94 TRINITY_DN10338_c0_g1_i1:237-1664(-)